MTCERAWDLFFHTGLPEAYLMTRAAHLRMEHAPVAEAKPAFYPSASPKEKH